MIYKSRKATNSHSFLFFFNATATTEIYTLSLHDALPISSPWLTGCASRTTATAGTRSMRCTRSEEHTSELQSRGHLVCRLLLEKKKKNMMHSLCLHKKIMNV